MKEKIIKGVPFEFVLDHLAKQAPIVKPMFGAFAIYVGEKLIFILRDKHGKDTDDGVWVATTAEHHESLHREFPSMRSIKLFGSGSTGWQILPSSSDDFEASVDRACELVRKGDVRIGKIPTPRKSPKKPPPKKR